MLISQLCGDENEILFPRKCFLRTYTNNLRETEHLLQVLNVTSARRDFHLNENNKILQL